MLSHEMRAIRCFFFMMATEVTLACLLFSGHDKIILYYLYFPHIPVIFCSRWMSGVLDLLKQLINKLINLFETQMDVQSLEMISILLPVKFMTMP